MLSRVTSLSLLFDTITNIIKASDIVDYCRYIHVTLSNINKKQTQDSSTFHIAYPGSIFTGQNVSYNITADIYFLSAVRFGLEDEDDVTETEV